MEYAFSVHKKNNNAIVQWLKSMSYVINNNKQNSKNSNILNMFKFTSPFGSNHNGNSIIPETNY